MIPTISLLIVLSLSILVIRIATIALSHTGLSREVAHFQARSAFTGVGFTTSETEKVVNHLVRRRIILLLMLLGNIGIITAISSLILTLISPKDSGFLNVRILFLIGGLATLWGMARSPWIDRHLSSLISRALKRYAQLDIRDYASLLRLASNYRVLELKVEPQDWLANKTLKELSLRDEGVLVLGIQRKNGDYVGAPRGETKILSDDILIVYGRASLLEYLDRREKGLLGNREHEEAVVEQRKVLEAEKMKNHEAPQR